MIYCEELQKLLNGCRSERGAGFDVEWVENTPRACSSPSYQSLIRATIGALDIPAEFDADNDEYFDPVSLRTFREERTGAAIVFCQVSTGGPGVTAIYESEGDTMRVIGLNLNERFEIIQRHEDESALKEWITAVMI